ncbi:uncharacterized protein N0V89_008033 [Didymosphaeria variabile]|uniref:Bifunctional cytochrome P450/NADPH--P450 reductase n=1 Tax=Didymosphaeria variabile TaxID=1932322 RepID=A0A9W9C8H0_9PLEO|nr:uncharacterized protein N0V89_008033 [Didymosphaeria variabile]KAJ4349418.1 hypothetical protein N0V89_008033 [Didymosphaeria variabile]
MDTRFNSFYSETPHSFVEAMNSFLAEAGIRMLRPSVVSDYVYLNQTRKFHEDAELMRHIAEQVIERRKASSSSRKDLVNAMLYEKDPVTDKSLPHSSVIDNMITFLIAGQYVSVFQRARLTEVGHETTSGLLSFIIYCLVTHPAAMEKGRDEVMSVLGNGAMTQNMASKLPYMMGIIRETLRLYPTAPGFTVQPRSTNPEDYPIHIGKEQYVVRQGEAVSVQIATVHRDPAVYGDDAESFRPERMLDDEFEKLPKNSWKPFGNGARACIGRALALQEAVIMMALLLQNFDFELADPNYELKIRKTITIKPVGLQIRVKLRDGLTPATLQRKLLGGKAPPSGSGRTSSQQTKRSDSPLDSVDLRKLLICYGSNTGTCQTLAHVLSRDAVAHGFDPTIMIMDKVQPHHITPSTPIVIVAASYEGQPPENASKFIKWLQALTESPFEGIYHAVYGCGNRDWAATFQRIPALVDDAFIRYGSTPIVNRAASDVADGNVANEFDHWADGVLWPALKKLYFPGVSARSFDISRSGIRIFQCPRTSDILPDGRMATIEDGQSLTAPGEPQKRQLTIRLPPTMTYRAGDHIAIVPANHHDTVKQVMNRFQLAHDTKIITTCGEERSVYTHLRDLVELNHVATEKNIRAIIETVPNSNKSDNSSIPKGLSALQILQKLPTATLPFADYLDMLPPMRPRRYSISSSPLADPTICTLTYSVLEHMSTLSDGTTNVFHGAGSTYLAGLCRNDRLHVSVQPSPIAFHLPEDPGDPIVMVCAGSGLAPFLGFVHERAQLRSSGAKLAPALLFIGCRHPDRDMLYSSQLQDLASSAGVKLFYAFSRAESQSKGCEYVQDRLKKERKLVVDAVGLRNGRGKMYVCGGLRVLEGVASVMKQAYVEFEGADGVGADEWWEAFRADGERFASEVFD